MKRILFWMACLALAAVFCVSCSDDTSTKSDTGPKKDGKVVQQDTGADTGRPDLTPDSKPDVFPVDSKMGEGCQLNSDCSADSPLCLMPDGSTQGICSKECTPDDATTPLINEDNCPSAFVCGSFRYSSQDFHYCLKKCTPSLTATGCPASSKRACHPMSTRFSDLELPVCWYLACTSGKDCPVGSDTVCGKDADCTGVGTDAFCNLSEGLCARPGNCTAGGICGPHTLGKSGALVGDACQNDFDCPGNGLCLREGSDTSAIGVSYRNGYCVVPNCTFAKDLPEYKCPSPGSSCNLLFYGGLCFKSCALDQATDCRGNALDKGGDYECYAWNNLQIGGTAVTATPVCMSAASTSCDSLGTKLDCSVLGGEAGNTTNMSCRDRYTGAAKDSKQDPTGICLDDTASGPFSAPGPDAGIPDTGTPDVGTPDAGTPDIAVVDAVPAE